MIVIWYIEYKKVQRQIEITKKCLMRLGKDSRYLVMADTKAANEGRFTGVVCRIEGQVDW